MALENLKISDDRSQELAKKMKEVKVIDEKTSVEEGDLAKNAIASLDNAKLATFIETQFKAGDKRKSFVDMKENFMYTFAVQAALDALGYDALLTGGDRTFGIDEVYGSRTKAAVKKFQEDMGLTASDIDGIVGEKTFALMSKRLRSIQPVFVNKTDNPKFGPVASPFIDGEISFVSDNVDVKKPLYTSLDQIVDNPFVKLPLYKSDVLVDYNGVQKPIGWVVMQMFNKGGLSESSVLSDYNLYKSYIVGDPILTSYILYRSMQGVGTYNQVVDKIFIDNIGSIDKIYTTFGKINDEDLIDFLISDFGGYTSLATSRKILEKYITQLGDESISARKSILARDEFIDRGLASVDLSKKGHLYSLSSKIAEWATLDGKQIASK